MHIPTEPECCNAEADDTNIPEPIITPRIMLTAEKSPSSLFKRTPLLASAFIDAVITSENKQK